MLRAGLKSSTIPITLLFHFCYFKPWLLKDLHLVILMLWPVAPPTTTEHELLIPRSGGLNCIHVFGCQRMCDDAWRVAYEVVGPQRSICGSGRLAACDPWAVWGTSSLRALCLWRLCLGDSSDAINS